MSTTWIRTVDTVLEEDPFTKEYLCKERDRILGKFRGKFPIGVPHADLVQAVKLYEGGWSATEIGQMMNEPSYTIRDWLNAGKVKMRTRDENNITGTEGFTYEEIEEARKLYESGLNKREVAEKLGISRFSCSRRLAWAGH